MIPQADLDRALARWKARQAGHEAPAEDAAVEAPAPQVRDASSGIISITEFDEGREQEQ